MRASLASKVILTGIAGKFVQVPAKVILTGKKVKVGTKVILTEKKVSRDKGDIDRKKLKSGQR
jgi:hypothetical protein